MILVDSHCHINSEDFNTDREQVVENARAAGVKYILDVSDDIADTPKIIEFCKLHKGVYTTAGVHPEIVQKYPLLEASKLIALTKSPYVVGIGECGLDYFYNSETKNEQIRILREHIIAAQETLLPLIIHNRDADEDMIKILAQMYKDKPFIGELHCFSSSKKLADFALEIGFYISASGIITFKKSDNLRDIFRSIPMDRLLIETDSPFLAPVPHRGKRNEPAYVVHTAQALAVLKGAALDEIAAQTTENFLKLYFKIL